MKLELLLASFVSCLHDIITKWWSMMCCYETSFPKIAPFIWCESFPARCSIRHPSWRVSSLPQESPKQTVLTVMGPERQRQRGRAAGSQEIPSALRRSVAAAKRKKCNIDPVPLKTELHMCAHRRQNHMLGEMRERFDMKTWSHRQKQSRKQAAQRLSDTKETRWTFIHQLNVLRRNS